MYQTLSDFELARVTEIGGTLLLSSMCVRPQNAYMPDLNQEESSPSEFILDDPDNNQSAIRTNRKATSPTPSTSATGTIVVRRASRDHDTPCQVKDCTYKSLNLTDANRHAKQMGQTGNTRHGVYAPPPESDGWWYYRNPSCNY